MSTDRPEEPADIAHMPAGSGSDEIGDLPTSRIPQLVSAPAAAVPNDSKINAIPARTICTTSTLSRPYNLKLMRKWSPVRRNALLQRSFEGGPKWERKHVETDFCRRRGRGCAIAHRVRRGRGECRDRKCRRSEPCR